MKGGSLKISLSRCWFFISCYFNISMLFRLSRARWYYVKNVEVFCFPIRYFFVVCYFFICRQTLPQRGTVQYRKWSPTANDPETANDPQNGPQMILDRKWSLKSTANDPVKTWGMEWILWEWLQKRTHYKKETFFSRLLKKKGRRTLHLRSIYTRRKKKWNKSEKVWY